jgi:hypothetical protein
MLSIVAGVRGRAAADVQNTLPPFFVAPKVKKQRI